MAAPKPVADDPVAVVEPTFGGKGKEPTCLTGCVGASALPRITSLEYRNTITDVFGVWPDVSRLPADGAIAGSFFTNENNTVSIEDIDRYRSTAESVADALFTDPALVTAVLAKVPGCATRNTACANAFIATYGAQLYRRALTAEELQPYRALYAWTVKVATDPELLTGGSGTFNDGLRYVLEQLLQAPGFLYRIEKGQPTRDPGVVALTSPEVAARLAAFLLRSVPDAELARAAERDELQTPEQIEAQTRRILASENGDRVWWFFAQDWLSTRQIPESNVKTQGDVPQFWNDAVAKDLAYDVHLTFAHLARTDGRLGTLLKSPGGIVQGDSLKWLVGTTGARWSWAPNLPNRHGLLTLPGVLIANGHPGFTHAHQRGLFVRSRFLCQTVGSPSPAIAAAIAQTRMEEENKPSAPTSRARLQAVTESKPSCASCHSLTNPIGYALDGFDDVGRGQTHELGTDGVSYPIDTSGELKPRSDGTLSTDVDGKFADGRALLDRLARSETVAACVTKQLSRFALQRDLQPDDQPSLDDANGAFRKSRHDLRELVVAVTTTEAFRNRRVATRP